VLNLLVRAEGHEEAERAAALVASLAVRTPSRTLQLLAVPDADSDGLDAAITTQRAIRPEGLGHLCYEAVRLVARGGTALHLASVAEPLIVANLPVILWWLGRPPRGHDPLLDLADRLIVDSAEFPDALVGLAALDACSLAEDKNLELGDLGWRRIAPWCQLIAQFFDPPDARPYQHRVTRVTVDYAATRTGVVSAAPLLLVGWLAARLGWEPEHASSAGGMLALSFAPDRLAGAARGSVTVRLRPQSAAGAEPGEVLAVYLTASHADHTAEFSVRWAENRTTAATRSVVPARGDWARIAPLERPSEAELLARELELPAADQVYAESLALIARAVR
jgi:glucose-6-phosphate dehydrogenase assembly protein OpcA